MTNEELLKENEKLRKEVQELKGIKQEEVSLITYNLLLLRGQT